MTEAVELLAISEALKGLLYATTGDHTTLAISLGFSIGRFLGSVARTVTSSIPVIGPAIAAGFTRPPAPSLPGPTVQQARFIPRAARVLGRAAGAAARRIDRRTAQLLAREMGIAAAATALGITALELAELLVAPARRRRRGITARQIQITKDTIRRVDSLNRAIAKACPSPSRRRAAIRR